MKKILVPFLVIAALLLASCGNGAGGGDSYTPFQGNDSYIDRSKPISGKTAKEIIKAMGAGWNLGNTLDAAEAGDTEKNESGSGTLKGVEATETSWKMPVTTKKMIDTVAKAGFTHIRIPVSWHNHIQGSQTNGTIDPQWLARVKEIVDWAIKGNNMYAVINIHHDTWSGIGSNFWGYSVDGTHESESTAFVENVWQQVATYFKDYDQHLLFETLNEPRLRGDAHEWSYGENCDKCKAAAQRINTLNKKALDKIRGAGGKNADRVVIVTPYVAEPWAITKTGAQFTLPTDTATSRLAISVHAYTPDIFASKVTDSGAVSEFNDTVKGKLDEIFNHAIKTFSVPVFIGEYGATNKNNLAERIKWVTHYKQRVEECGAAFCLWDNMDFGTGSNAKEFYGALNRNTCTWYEPTYIKAITGYTPGTAPVQSATTAVDLTKGGVWNDGSATNKYTVTTSGGVVTLSHSGSITPEKQNWSINPTFGSNTKVALTVKNTGANKAFVKVTVQNSSYKCLITEAKVNNETVSDVENGVLKEIASNGTATYKLTFGSGANAIAITLNGEGDYTGENGSLKGLRSDMPTSGSITISDAYMYAE